MAKTQIAQNQVRGLETSLAEIRSNLENGLGAVSAAAKPAIKTHTHLNGSSATFAEISGKQSVKIYKNGILMRPAADEETPGTLEFVNVTGLSDIVQFEDADIDLDIDGTAQQIENCDFTNCSTLEDLAEVINTAASGKVYCEVNSTGHGIVFISPTLGTSSSVATNSSTSSGMIAALGGTENGNMVETSGQADSSSNNDYSISGTTVTFAEPLNIHDVITTECL